MNFITERLQLIHEKGLSRSLKRYGEPIDLSSNDHLGLARSTEFNARFLEKVAQLDTQGSTGSRLLTGNYLAIEQLEEKIATFHDSESALLFPTGYMANFGLIQALAQKGDTIIRDEFCHASTVDGVRSTLARAFKFKHNDLNDLERKLQAAQGNMVVAAEALYSMHGDVPDLRAMVELCESYGAHLIIDEAHSAGVFGEAGKGLIYELELSDKILASVVTYGKSFGYQGGSVLCSKELKDYLVNTCRPFIFSTGMNAHQVLGISIAYDLVRNADKERADLRALVAYFIQKRSTSSGNWLPSNTHIQGLVVGDNARVMALAERCAEHDLLVLPIRRPSVPKDGEMLRVTLHSFNTKQEVDRLFEILCT